MSSERGEFSLTGLLVAMVLMLIVTGAAFSVFGTFDTVTRKTTLQNDAQDKARTAVDRLAIELRNLASPTFDAPFAVQAATASDLLFQTVDKTAPAGTTQNPSNIKRVRYCLSAAGTLYRGSQGPWTTSTPPALPSAVPGPCPGSWPSTIVATDVITGTRPLFTFNDTTLTNITRIGVNLALQTDPRQKRGDTEISSGVYLRNQNRAPTATFTLVKTATGVVLNAAGSSDPEGDVLTYTWSDITASGTTQLGTGVTITVSPLVNGSYHTFHLEAADSGGLVATYEIANYQWIR